MPIHKLRPSFHARPWGTTVLEPWFPNPAAANPTTRIGEAWFHTDGVPLVKFLFTTEKLSVQVHPGDEYARRHHSSPGKSEMWHVLAAEPGAQIAAGFREPLTRQQAAAAAESGEIENLLQWFDAQPRDTFFIPAGTVHAIGAGLTICEIQQYSDITYRLYDYGRPRELHLSDALAVAELGPLAARRTLPVECHAFVTALGFEPRPQGPQLLIAIGGSGAFDGQPIHGGEVLYLPPGAGGSVSGAVEVLRTFVP